MSLHTLPEGLYVITESVISRGRSNSFIVEEAIRGGAKIIQLREKEWSKEQYAKEAHVISQLCTKHGVPFVVNDYPDVALAVKADGLHLGQSDMPLRDARRIVSDMMIGKSTHSRTQALDAQEEGADYISIGPVYPTRRKPNPVGVSLIEDVVSDLRIPFVAIGGIKLHNVSDVLSCGARCVAVISAVVEADDVYSATSQLAFSISSFSKKKNCSMEAEHI